MANRCFSVCSVPDTSFKRRLWAQYAQPLCSANFSNLCCPSDGVFAFGELLRCMRLTAAASKIAQLPSPTCPIDLLPGLLLHQSTSNSAQQLSRTFPIDWDAVAGLSVQSLRFLLLYPHFTSYGGSMFFIVFQPRIVLHTSAVGSRHTTARQRKTVRTIAATWWC